MEIVRIFNANVRHIHINLEHYPGRHDGKEGHWLESKMGLQLNSKNEPDMYGFELKKSSSKITLGDFSASEYLFSKTTTVLDKENRFDGELKVDRSDFIRYFGTPKVEKNNRYSWSGKCVPTYGEWNSCGQMLSVSQNNDICIYYSFNPVNVFLKYLFDKYLDNLETRSS